VIKLVITDLDNTLYDWVGYFVPAFDAMVAELSRTTDVPEAELIESFRRVHQRHGTSEYLLAVAELDALAAVHGDLDIRERLRKHAPAVAAFDAVRSGGLQLYPDVLPTLDRLRADGRLVVAHTDAMSLYARARMRQLGIEDRFDGLWAVSDHELPPDLAPADFRELVRVDVERTPFKFGRDVGPDEQKPTPSVVQEILRATGVEPSEAIYIGDSLSKDVLVAQQAGVIDVYAGYGRAHDRAQYQRLVDVTHWTESDVERERALRAHHVAPSFVASRFGDLLGIVDRLETVSARRSAITA
jgi:phosphoglycolate phosphatase